MWRDITPGTERPIARERYEQWLERLVCSHDDDPRDEPCSTSACESCGRPYAITAGERRFSEQTGLPLATECRQCRPTRRERATSPTPQGGGECQRIVSPETTLGSRFGRNQGSETRLRGTGGRRR